jgi:predicted nucleic acid-binding protein
MEREGPPRTGSRRSSLGKERSLGKRKALAQAAPPSKKSTVILLLDTTVLLDVLRARQNRRSLLAELVTAGHLLATAAINIAEVYAGMRSGEEARTEAFLSSLECYPMTGAIARRAGSLKSFWAQKGRTLSLADMMIAATALEHSLALMTDNRKDFPLPELTFYPWP